MTRTIVGGALTFNAANNRITTAGYTYDASGNLTNDTLHIYTFDAENKISKVDAVSAYVYNGEGQRVKKLVGENTRFVYGIGEQLVAEFDGVTGNLEKEYVQAGATLITIEPTAVNSNGTRYTTSDTLGSPRVVTSSSAGVVSRHDFMPFGEELGVGVGGRTTAQGFSVVDGLRQKFTEKERDNETGLDSFGARYYASLQGRFTSPDPLLSSATIYDPQTWNRYSHVLNNPLRFVDPLGLYEWDSSLGGSASDEELNKTDHGRQIVHRRNEFRTALRQAAVAMMRGKLTNQQRNEINKSLTAYAGEGDANGVTIANGKVKNNAAAETTSGNKEGFTVDPATGAVKPCIIVTLNRDKSIDAETAAHEGSHVADRESLIGEITPLMSNEDLVKSPLNLTEYATEFRAYEVGRAVAQGRNEAAYNANGYEYWNSSWKAAEREMKVREGINAVLKNKPYKVTPDRPGPRLIELKN